MIHDKLHDELRSLRTEPDGWATSPAGQNVMARAIAMAQRGENPARDGRPAVRRTRNLAIVGISAGVVMATGAAAATVLFREADSPTQAGCYEALDPQADTTEPIAALVAEVGPIKACVQTWKDLGTPVDVTNLVSCVNEFGGRGVFPAAKGLDPQTACGQIGWAVDAG